jgi:hypothetical protein
VRRPGAPPGSVVGDGLTDGRGRRGGRASGEPIPVNTETITFVELTGKSPGLRRVAGDLWLVRFVGHLGSSPPAFVNEILTMPAHTVA